MKKTNLKQQAYQIIRQKIMDCEYAPGALINENILLDAVPGSRTPVRDAVGRLEQEGLVTILPKKGILVAPISSKTISYVYATRFMWEPYAVLRYGITLSTDFYMDYYQRLCPKEAPLPTDPGIYQSDLQFHAAFIQATRNPYIIGVCEQTMAEDHRLRILTGTNAASRVLVSLGEHREILLACLEKDWTRASESMKNHLEASRQSVMEALLKL